MRVRAYQGSRDQYASVPVFERRGRISPGDRESLSPEALLHLTPKLRPPSRGRRRHGDVARLYRRDPDGRRRGTAQHIVSPSRWTLNCNATHVGQFSEEFGINKEGNGKGHFCQGI